MLRLNAPHAVYIARELVGSLRVSLQAGSTIWGPTPPTSSQTRVRVASWGVTLVGNLSMGFFHSFSTFDMLYLDRYMLVAAQLLFGCGIGPQFVPHSFVQGTVDPVVPPSAPLPNPVQCL